MFYFVLGNVYLTFKKADGICGFWKFWNLEMFYPPKGRLLADSKGVHLFLLMFYFVLGNVDLSLKKADGICRFWKFLSRPPTWHQILKPIRMLVTSFDYIYKRLHIWSIYTQSIKKIEGHFWYPIPSHPIPSIPSIPSHPSVDLYVRLLDPKNQKSPTCCNFEIFDHDP